MSHLQVGKRNKRYVVIASIWILSLLAMGLTVQSFGSSTSLPPWTLNAPPTSGYDYYIGTYTNGTYYYETGNWQTWANSDNASYIFNTVSAFGAGKIYVSAATYTFYNATEIRSNQLWDGAGEATILKIANNLPNSNNAFWINFCLFRTSSLEGSYIENVTIQNIQFDGNNANNAIGSITHGFSNLWFSGARHVIIDNIYTHSSLNNGVDFTGYFRDSYDCIVQNSKVCNNHWNGISFGAGDYNIYDCKAENNELWGDIGDIALCAAGAGQAYRIEFINNVVRDMTGTQGSSGSFWCGIKFEGMSNSCRADGNKLLGVTYGVYEAGAAFGNHSITNNEIHLKDSVAVPEGINTAHSHNLIAYNTIYAAPTNDSRAIKLPNDLSDNSYNRVIGNKFVDKGSGYFESITATGGTYNIFAFNDLTYADSPIQNGTNCQVIGNIP
jgi:hypothetical protein